MINSVRTIHTIVQVAERFGDFSRTIYFRELTKNHRRSILGTKLNYNIFILVASLTYPEVI